MTKHILLKVMVHLSLQNLLSGGLGFFCLFISVMINYPFTPCLSVRQFCRFKFFFHYLKIVSSFSCSKLLSPSVSDQDIL